MIMMTNSFFLFTIFFFKSTSTIDKSPVKSAANAAKGKGGQAVIKKNSGSVQAKDNAARVSFAMKNHYEGEEEEESGGGGGGGSSSDGGDSYHGSGAGESDEDDDEFYSNHHQQSNFKGKPPLSPSSPSSSSRSRATRPSRRKSDRKSSESSSTSGKEPYLYWLNRIRYQCMCM
jgi:hypothetical protein